MATKPYIFAAELAKSGAAGCKGCKEKIAKGALRVGVITVSKDCLQFSNFGQRYGDNAGPVALVSQEDMDECESIFDQMGWLWRWHHVDCFHFDKYPALKDMSCFCSKSPIGTLSAADQKTLEGKIGGKADASAKGKAKAKGKAEPKAKGEAAPKARAEAKAVAEPKARTTGVKRKASAMLDLAGKTIVFTGTLSMKRADAEAAAKAAGGKIGSGISKTTDILVCGPGAGSKLAKAESLGITTWDEATFKSKVGM